MSSLRNLYTTSPWQAAEDLAQRVKTRLMDIAADSLAPWVRIARTVFRAAEIRHSGDNWDVRGTVRSDRVLAELSSLAERRSSVPFATVREAADLRIEDVSTTTTSTGRVDVAVRLQRYGTAGRAIRMSLNGISADDLARMALEDGLFGTQNLPRDGFAVVKAVDPLAPLRGAGLVDAALRPVAHLLVAEQLYRSDEAQSVDAFRLGPDFQGQRALEVRWTPPRRYDNVPDPQPVSISGRIVGL